jgi:hypothetical protein
MQTSENPLYRKLGEERILRSEKSLRATREGKHGKAEREGEKARKTTVQ